MDNFKLTKQTNTSILIEIDTKTLSVSDQIQFFGNEYSKLNPNEKLLFIQDDDFIFEVNTLLYFELDPRFRMIKKGNYPLEIINEIVRVSIILSPCD